LACALFSGTAQRCLNGDPDWTVVAQSVVSIIGLIGAGLMLRAFLEQRVGQALVWLVLALCLYATWAILLDAATHGWHKLKLM